MKDIILAAFLILIPAAVSATEIALVSNSASMGHQCTDCHKFNEAKFKEITKTPDASIISTGTSVIGKTVEFGSDLLKIKGTPLTALSGGRMIEGMVDANTMKEIFR